MPTEHTAHQRLQELPQDRGIIGLPRDGDQGGPHLSAPCFTDDPKEAELPWLGVNRKEEWKNFENSVLGCV